MTRIARERDTFAEGQRRARLGRAGVRAVGRSVDDRRFRLCSRHDQTAKRRDFHDLRRTEPDVRQPESPADNPAIPEQFLDLVRVCVGADVEVLRPPSEQQVTHTAADEVGAVAVIVEPIEDAKGICVDQAARDAVTFARNDLGVDHVSRV